jgi:hypothetical protein
MATTPTTVRAMDRPRAIDARLGHSAALLTPHERSVERYFECFEQGRLSPARCEQRVAGLQARSRRSSPRTTGMLPGRQRNAALAAVAGRLEALIADGQPEQTKALLRLLIAGCVSTARPTSSQPTVS